MIRETGELTRLHFARPKAGEIEPMTSTDLHSAPGSYLHVVRRGKDLPLSARSMGTVGEKLREAREGSNRTLRELSDQTKIRADHLEALEEGRYDVFSAPVYIRGFVRSYAGALRMNVAEVLSDLDDELGRTEKFSDHPPLTDSKKGVIDFLMLQLSKVNWTVALPLLLLAVVLLLAIAGYRVYTHSRTVDPLKDLGPGLYQGQSQGQSSGETLPVPTSTN